MRDTSKLSVFKCTSFLDFIETVASHDLVSPLILYRGQADADWSLQPSITRHGVDATFLEREKEFIEEFKRLSRSLIPSDVLNNDWDLLAYAQHHGLHTRLLDWSTNPLAALWFAFEHEKEVESRAVWTFIFTDEHIADKTGSPFRQQRTMAFKPNHVTQRITAQNGWFTTHKFVSTKEKFIPLDDNSLYKKRIFKYELSNDLREDVLSGLDRFGINAASIYPDLSGLTEYLNWKRK